MKKIEYCSEKLSLWNRASFGNVQRCLSLAQEKLRMAHQNDPLSLNRQQIQLARKAVQQWLQRSEIMWKQRSKVLWLAEGDRNSKFFHHKASQRKKKNCIKGVKDSTGMWQVNEERDRVITEYF
ncbi:uncharacterized protein LOC122293610 [Carya illinoinensis]|uniref:uncharacterized protein LOC122293610 n=1 Tax=Carya illinoinensis TaxID=32201 RepID=UPI001C718CAB|nr:uncharacterized protein LOC122293610 [Carya illinoinensis]